MRENCLFGGQFSCDYSSPLALHSKLGQKQHFWYSISRPIGQLESFRYDPLSCCCSCFQRLDVWLLCLERFCQPSQVYELSLSDFPF